MNRSESMPNLNSEKAEIDWSSNELTLPSDPKIVQKLVAEVEARFHNSHWPDATINNAIVVVTEQVNNAILHGNLEVPGLGSGSEGYKERLAAALASELQKRQVKVNLDINEQTAMIKVKDEGKGIPTTGVPDPTADENLGKEGGRGLFLINSLADKVEINGSEITVYFYKVK